MKVKFTLPAPKIVDIIGEDGHPEGQGPMPAHGFRFVNDAGEEVIARDGQVLEVSEDIYRRCLQPHGLAIPVASIVPNAGAASSTKSDQAATTRGGKKAEA